jgi:hypothetical protein
MAKSLRKPRRIVPLEDFLSMAKDLEYFQGTGEMLYEVIGSEGDELIFISADGKKGPLQGMDLRKIYQAYHELQDFSSVNVSKYIAPRWHSAAKGLLIQCQMLVRSPKKSQKSI